MCRLVLPGVRTGSPFEEGILHLGMGGLVSVGDDMRGMGLTLPNGGCGPCMAITEVNRSTNCRAQIVAAKHQALGVQWAAPEPQYNVP